MTDLLQILFTGVFVAVALLFVGYRVVKSWTGKSGSGCQSCSNCPEAEHGKVGIRKPLISLENSLDKPRKD